MSEGTPERVEDEARNVHTSDDLWALGVMLFEMLAGQYFDRAFRKMVNAFETRAEELYGKRSSSAQSVA